jgi:hypothetical protein
MNPWTREKWEQEKVWSWYCNKLSLLAGFCKAFLFFGHDSDAVAIIRAQVWPTVLGVF